MNQQSYCEIQSIDIKSWLAYNTCRLFKTCFKNFQTCFGRNITLLAITNAFHWTYQTQAMLRQYGPGVPDATLKKLVSAFGELRSMADDGLISYPYSTREVVSVVKHLQASALVMACVCTGADSRDKWPHPQTLQIFNHLISWLYHNCFVKVPKSSLESLPWMQRCF